MPDPHAKTETKESRALRSERAGPGDRTGLGSVFPGGHLRLLFLALDIDLAKQRGDTVHAVELAAAFDALGHSVTFVVGASGPLAKVVPESVRLVVASGADARVIYTILSCMRTRTPSIIYERRTSPKIGFAIKGILHVPLVLEINGLLGDELTFQGRGASKPLAGTTLNRIRRTLLRGVDHFVVVSNAIREDLVKTYRVEASRISVVGNGVNVDRFRPTSKYESCTELGLRPDVPRAVFEGNLIGWRDLDTVLDAMEILRGNLPEVELLVLGDGPERARLQERAAHGSHASAVQFLGPRPHSEVPMYICASDVGLLPAVRWRVDVSPVKLFEYMACARPVVATDVPGLEIIRGVGAGRLVPPQNAHAMAQSLEEILRDAGLRDEMGRMGRQYVEKERTWIAVASRVTKVLLGITKVDR